MAFCPKCESKCELIDGEFVCSNCGWPEKMPRPTEDPDDPPDTEALLKATEEIERLDKVNADLLQSSQEEITRLEQENSELREAIAIVQANQQGETIEE